MLLYVCTVFDSKVAAYTPPAHYRSRGEAIRSFEDVCKDSSSPLAKHPNDYSLFYLGTFDDNTALYQMELAPVPLAAAHEVLAQS